MPSSYSSNLRFTLPATGENANTWGDLVNNGITSLVDASIAGYSSIAMTDADYTLTTANGAADEARKMMLNMTGTLTAARNVICPAGVTKLYVIKNATTGGFAITLKYSTGTGVSIPNGSTMILMCDGTNVTEALTNVSSFSNITYTGTLTGGTGVVNIGSGQFYKDSSGNIGIGTSSLTAGFKLDVYNSANNFIGVRSAGTSSAGIEFAANGNTLGSAGFTLYQDTANAGWLFNRSNAALIFATNSTERMRIDSSGNVGIGATPATANLTTLQLSTSTTLTSPTNELYLSQNAAYNSGWKYLSNAYAAQYNINQVSGTHHWNTAASGTTGNAVAFAERMRLTNSGFLGIGTTSPQANFVVSNGSASGLEIAPAGGYGLGPAITSYNRSTLAYMPITNYALNHTWWAGNIGRGMDLDADGNLGIGTSSPGAKLHVLGSNVVVQNASPSFSLWKDGTPTKAGRMAFNNVASDAIQFDTYDGASWSSRMLIDSSGNVGIGTSSPSVKLDVIGTAKLRDAATTLDMGNSTGISYIQSYSSVDTSATPLLFYTGTSERMRLDTNGNLLLGTTGTGPLNSNSISLSPGNTGGADFNHISGTASGVMFSRFNLNAGTIGSITQSGTTAVLYNTTSDRRLKTNIVDAPDAAALIDSIKVRSFDWVSDSSHQRYGMVAQELAEVAPEAVHSPQDAEEMMAVDYSKLVPMLVKEIQALRARVAALEH